MVIPIPVPSLPLILIIGIIALIARFTKGRSSVVSSGASFYHSLAGRFSLRSNWLTFALFLALAIAYICEGKSIADALDPSFPNMVSLGAVSRATVANGEWYRLFTAPFLHGGLLHIFSNSIALFYASRILESRVGKIWLLAIYFVSALSGSVFSTILNKPDTLSVGASGAIMGLFVAILVISVHHTSHGKRSD